MENPPVLFLTIYHRPSTMWHVTNTPAIDDAEILGWIKAGILVVRDDANGPIEVWKWHGKRRRYERLKVYACDSDGRLRCNLRYGAKSNGGRQRTCYLNKLVWLFNRRELIPSGWVLNHVDECCTNDRYENLELQTQEESDKQGGRLSTAVGDDDEYGEF